jgi:hypothetical protein
MIIIYVKILNTIGKIHKDEIYVCQGFTGNGSIAIIKDDNGNNHFISKSNYELIFD